MLKVAVLVSGGGTNLQALIDAGNAGKLGDAVICTVISSRKDAYALERAAREGIHSYVLARSAYADAESYAEALSEILESEGAQLIVLAGFMSILSSAFTEKYRNRIINIHPSLIPAFCGKGSYGIMPHRKALEYGVKVSGATVHFVEAETDAGPIILQKAISIEGIDNEDILQQKIMKECEQELLPLAVKLISEGRVTVEGRKVNIQYDNGKVRI